MEVLAIIPARAGSKGIPGKNSKLLAGRPLIEYTFDMALQCGSLTRIVVSTDSESIARLARERGVEVPFLRPAQFAGDNSPATEYIGHCLSALARQEQYRPDIVVLLQPTTPFRAPEDVAQCIKMLIHSKADSIVSVCELPVKYHPQWQFILDHDRHLLRFNSGSFGRIVSARQQLEPTYTRNGAVYAFWRHTFENTGTIYGNHVLGFPMSAERSINIDDMEDWQKAEEMLCNPITGDPNVRTDRTHPGSEIRLTL
ncbi:MAG: acylneuraminate cytidylyltransferase family protein [Sedimentisphaerales bacterium]|nr:acylneuraminate cytidylyltransferase family protein [Sedimentisphaerales bacterium]